MFVKTKSARPPFPAFVLTVKHDRLSWSVMFVMAASMWIPCRWLLKVREPSEYFSSYQANHNDKRGQLASSHEVKKNNKRGSERSCVRQGHATFKIHCWPFVGESTKHGPLRGPGPSKYGPGSWTPAIFFLALKLVVINDYECGLRLWCNLNGCLLLKSFNIFANRWTFTDKKFLFLRNLNSSEESLQTGSPNWFYSYVYIFF